MATYADLTPEQQARYQAFESMIRPLVGQMARAFRGIEDAKREFDQAIWPMVYQLTGDLDSNSGLSGVKPLNPDDLNVLMNKLVTNILASNNDDTSRKLYINVAGLVNV